MKEGTVTKLVGGKYSVRTKEGDISIVIPRGKLRHKGVSPKVGDTVTFDQTTMYDVLKRRNDFERPPIANVDQAVIVNSTVRPDFSPYLLDRFLIIVEMSEVEAHIVLNKSDLVDEKTLSEMKSILDYYAQYYPVHIVNKFDTASLETLKRSFDDVTSVLAGQSGAGKSSLLNAMDASLTLKTGEVSKALNRGKHTTRHVELLPLSRGLVADTPGFSKLSLNAIDKEHLRDAFPEFIERQDACKFRQCQHINEPGCVVKDAVQTGVILKTRYESYQRIHEELTNKKTRY